MKQSPICLLVCGVLGLAVGCGGPATPPAPQAPVDDAVEGHHEHHHHGAGPHGGVVADWGGGEYHVELTVDHDDQAATVYVLGSDAVTPAPIASEEVLLSITEPAFQVELAPSPLPEDAEGTSSRFVGRHENLGIVRDFAGTLSVEVDGTPYAADFSETPHEH